MTVFKINKYITLKLEGETTNIYINDILFRHCKYLLINISSKNTENYKNIESIDEAAELLDRKLEMRSEEWIDKIAPEVEFWGHCSNLQVWVENEYDSRILHRNLAFPMLKKLTEIGDPVAKKAFKDEIAIRFSSNIYNDINNFIIESSTYYQIL